MATVDDHLPLPAADQALEHRADRSGRKRICLVYDCLYPHTVGGAERWYRNLAERLVAEGHEVTYLTLRQWDRDDDPGVEGVDVVAVGPRMALYTAAGRRSIGPPLRFGLGVLAHLLRNPRSYDVVHTASFPYFALLAAGFLRPFSSFRLVVDWHEVWTLGYWQEYLGRIGGRIGWLVQRACVRLPQRAFCFSRLHAGRLGEEGFTGRPTVLEGEYAGDPEPVGEPLEARPSVVFAGRHIAEKRVDALVGAMALVHEVAPELVADIYGDGPERARLERLVAEHGLEEVVRVHGFVAWETVDEALRTALCMVMPSRREGYSLVVVEASARGLPSVLVADPDNAATELVEEGVNGIVSPSVDAMDLARAILEVREAGHPMRVSTARWYEENAERLSLGNSLSVVSETYAAVAAERVLAA